MILRSCYVGCCNRFLKSCEKEHELFTLLELSCLITQEPFHIHVAFINVKPCRFFVQLKLPSLHQPKYLRILFAKFSVLPRIVIGIKFLHGSIGLSKQWGFMGLEYHCLCCTVTMFAQNALSSLYSLLCCYCKYIVLFTCTSVDIFFKKTACFLNFLYKLFNLTLATRHEFLLCVFFFSDIQSFSAMLAH